MNVVAGGLSKVSRKRVNNPTLSNPGQPHYLDLGQCVLPRGSAEITNGPETCRECEQIVSAEVQ